MNLAESYLQTMSISEVVVLSTISLNHFRHIPYYLWPTMTPGN